MQVGSKDISTFIDAPLETKGGDKVKLHDATLYKGRVYGIELPDRLNAEYSKLIGEISDANAKGETLATSDKIRDRVATFKDDVGAHLPEKLAAEPEAPLSKRAIAGNVVGRGLGVAGAIGGALQLRQGIAEIEAGETVVGAADVAAGTAGAMSGVALTVGRFALGTSTGGVTAVLDGARDVYVGSRGGDAEKVATGTIKAASGTAMIAGVATLNPVLVAGGAAAYLATAVWENRAAMASAVSAGWSWVSGVADAPPT